MPAHQPYLHSPQSERIKIAEEMEGKDPDAQIKLADAFLARYPQDPYANFIRAAAQFSSDDNLASVPFAQVAVQNGNFEPEYVSLLLRIYLEYRFFEQIEKVLSVALKHPATSDDLEFHIGRYYARIAQSENAVKHFRNALALSPSAALKTNILWELFSVYGNSDQKEEAKGVLREIALIDSERPLVLLHLAEGAKDEERANLETEISKFLEVDAERLTDSEKSKLHLGLGRLQEKRKDHAAAFASWQRSRALAGVEYRPADIEHNVKELKKIYTAELFERTKPFSSSSEAPVFVFGMPRSGTTLVAQILSTHPDAASSGEIGRLQHEAQIFLQRYFVSGGLKQLLADSQKGEISGRVYDFLHLCEVMAGRKAKHYVDKTPTQFYSAGYIHLCFPKVRFINLVRHPADIFISTYQNDFQASFTYAFGQETFAHYYLQRELIIAHWKKLFGHLILDVRYEELTADPEAQVRRILDFLGLEWDPACLKFFERPAMINTFSRDQVRSSINTKSVGRWRNYEAHLGPLFEALQKGGVELPSH